MRGTKRPFQYKRAVFREQAADTVYPGYLDAFLQRDGGKYGGDSPCEHGLAGTWRPDQKQIVHAGRRDLCRAFERGLSVDLRKIHIIPCLLYTSRCV